MGPSPLKLRADGAEGTKGKRGPADGKHWNWIMPRGSVREPLDSREFLIRLLPESVEKLRRLDFYKAVKTSPGIDLRRRNSTILHGFEKRDNLLG